MAVIAGYLFGCVNMAYIISNSQGINIKKVGSNNAGASNVFLSVGKKFGVAVGAFDILKAFCAAELVAVLFPGKTEAAVIAGVMAVIGHIFPFWMKFSGGKGLAPFMGTVLFFNWKLFLVFAVLIAAITLITDYISIGTFTVVFLMPAYMIATKSSLTLIVIFTALFVLVIYKHKDNIERLMKGEEIGMRGKRKKNQEK